MKKMNFKKYPLLISLIISCVIVVVSLFILGFFGMRVGTSLAGGSQIEITIPNEANTKNLVADAKSVVRNNGYDIDSAFVEDKYISGEENTKYTTKCVVIKIAEKNISDERKAKLIDELSTKLKIDKANISDVFEITSSVTSRNILFVGLAVGFVAICLFIFSWIRYDIFAGLSFLLAYLHNIILYISLLILTRVQLSLISLSVGLVLTLVMGAVLIAIYEKHREKVRLHLDDKLGVSERMIVSEKETIVPFSFIFLVTIIFACLMFFIPVSMVRLSAVNIILATLVTVYTTFLIGPGSYASLLEIRNANLKAVLSRNHEINKQIKKKIKKNAPKHS